MEESFATDRQEEVIEQLCQITSNVGRYFESRYASDCFCVRRKVFKIGMTFQFDDNVLDFIRNAVNEKIAREPRDKDTIARNRFLQEIEPSCIGE